ncbi:polyketide synthase [Pseudomonas qingdaonensis]|nr:polyketide synthase [Pseudomonas qingdaonensis]
MAALVLAPLAAAQANGDFIYGQVCASAQNHGGRAHSFTAPNPKAQTEVITRAWQQSGHCPSQARMIETHGTGTPLGDPIEINALKNALPTTEAGTPIALGALKSQIGHLEAAAGIASVIKSLLCLQHRQVVGNLHHDALNPQIELAGSPFYLPDATHSMGEQDAPLLAGVSAFGFGGVNAHVVLKAADRGATALACPTASRIWCCCRPRMKTACAPVRGSCWRPLASPCPMPAARCARRWTNVCATCWG